jgi:hypothetical protein
MPSRVFEKCLTPPTFRGDQANSHALDANAVEALWSKSEELAGESF